ncbi:MAG: hypothetical protein JRF63_00900 [Deltaproteobacteria bacterium]|nr:hypothetical protein [Deltaproteobacteria bacterium]
MPRSHLGQVWRLSTSLVLTTGLLAVSTAFAEDEKPEPLDKIGDATWSDNVGLVRRTADDGSEEAGDEELSEEEARRDTAQPGAEPGETPASVRMTVPHIGGADVGYGVKVGGPLVAGDQIGGRDSNITKTWGVVAGLRLRGEYPRALTSLLVPWGHGTLWVGGYPDADSMVVGGDIRVGLDIHPLRWPWLGVGPLIEYRVSKFFEIDGDGQDFFGHGLGFGGHVIFRTKESPGNPPLFFADVAIVERVTMGSENENLGGRSAAYFDAILGIGGNYRFLVFVDAPMGGDHYQGVRVGVGGGGYY